MLQAKSTTSGVGSSGGQDSRGNAIGGERTGKA